MTTASSTVAQAMSHRPMINALCRWFEREARDLPWRKRRLRNGYAALVAETMLQQTQVSRVVDRFQRFMQSFPDVASLAAADEQEVLSLWQGLGYYRRARNLHAASKMIVREFAGRVPGNTRDLRRLPGVGRYTAGAVASLVFGQAEPIVDGNIKRVMARLFVGRRGPRKRQQASDRAHGDRTWTLAHELVAQADRPGVFNEALMELGATVCLPQPASPRCDACPLARWCEARKAGLQQTIPAPRLRRAPRAVHHHAVVITRPGGRHILLEQRPTGGMWGGLWQAPTFEATRRASFDRIAHGLPQDASATLRRCGEFVHKTTHRLIRFHVYRAISRSRRGRWHTAASLHELPMSSAQRRVLAIALDDQTPGIGKVGASRKCGVRAESAGLWRTSGGAAKRVQAGKREQSGWAGTGIAATCRKTAAPAGSLCGRMRIAKPARVQEPVCR